MQPILKFSTQVYLVFPMFAQWAIAVDHCCRLYTELSKVLSSAHVEKVIRVHPITGRQIGERMLQLMPYGAVRIPALQARVSDGGRWLGTILLDVLALRHGLQQKNSLKARHDLV